jgi:hypothetical protein
MIFVIYFTLLFFSQSIYTNSKEVKEQHTCFIPGASQLEDLVRCQEASCEFICPQHGSIRNFVENSRAIPCQQETETIRQASENGMITAS